MAGTAVRGGLKPLRWREATVVEVAPETSRASNLVLQVPDWPGHRAGQHVDVRLTAEDGYQAQRGYSIASAPEDEHVVLTVERIDDGEVSPYLVDVLQAGDQLELRGPIGGYFIWEEALGGPLMLLAGGSGVAPLRAMLRHRLARQSSIAVCMLYSSRALGDVFYREELAQAAKRDGVDVHLTLTREHPPDWDGYTGRINRDLIAEVVWSPAERPLAYICGPTAFVETAADSLVALGHEPGRIRTERFGPT